MNASRNSHTSSSLTERTVPELVAEQAKKNPRHTALVMETQSLTYGELEDRAAQLANYLQSLGAGPESVVGICMERSLDFVVAALAIMKCGAAYLPMDPAHPAERLRFVAQDASLALLVTDQDFAEHFRALDLRKVLLDSESDTIAKQPTHSPETAAKADDLAYVIYTSGSTGQPKGVEVTHENLSNLVAWHARAFGVNEATRATSSSGVGFDATVWELWSHLAVGAAVYLPNESTRLSAEALREWLIAHKITITFASTAIAEQLLTFSWPKETALRFLLTGADTLRRYPPGDLPFALVNNYGPTECTVVTTSGIVAPKESERELPAIGAPIDNVTVHIVDEQLREVGHGAIGEICIGGAGVARGYRNRAELTAERFVPNPFAESGKLYRTGDLGRRLPNGEIAFVGRVDDQVKIRGFRIELGEITNVLNQQPGVKTSVVIAREDTPGDKRIVAYLVGAETRLNERSLREAIRQQLPDYMEPSAFVWLDSLPLNSSGKIDRGALPLPQTEDISREEEFVAPRNETEEALAGIIREVLKLPRVSVDDDFFHLGAHSLLGAQIVAHVRRVFGAELKLLDVFDAPTVAQLSLKIEAALASQINAMSDAEIEAALAEMNENAQT